MKLKKQPLELTATRNGNIQVKEIQQLSKVLKNDIYHRDELGLATTLIQTSTNITSLNPELNTKSNLVETENQSSPVKIDSYKKEFSLDLTTLEVITEQLNIPWAITFLPDDSLLITERPDNLISMHGFEQ